MSLSDDIVFTILSQVPAKFLLQWKCVSKSWHRLISDPSFIHTQARNSNSISGIFLQSARVHHESELDLVTYVPIGAELSVVQNAILGFLPEKVVVTASCNGLLCCRSYSNTKGKRPVLYIGNPSTKEWAALEPHEYHILGNFGIAYDPFSPSRGNNFKVVNIRMSPTGSNLYTFDIYSSERGGTWTKSKEICHFRGPLRTQHGVYAKGVLYWLTCARAIITFDVDKEHSKVIAAPDLPVIGYYKHETCIGVSKGCLHYIHLSLPEINIWILKDGIQLEWSLRITLPIWKMHEEYPHFPVNGFPDLIIPLAFQDEVLFMKDMSIIFSYNLETNRLEEVFSTKRLRTGLKWVPNVHPYSISLLPLHARRGRGD